MSAARRGADHDLGVDLTPSPMTEHLRPQAARRRGAATFTGFLGKSQRPGHVRLYVDPYLLSWLEIAEKDVVHREDLPATSHSVGVSALWVRQNAPVGDDGATARTMTAEMLSGELIQRYLPESWTDEQVAEGFVSTMVCATVAITFFLCVTPSCVDISVPLLCDDIDDDPDDDDDDEHDDDDDDDDDHDDPSDPGGNEPDTESPTG